MRRRRTVKYWIGRLHLWLGLVSGLVVLVVSLTGCLFVFQKEISERLHREWFFVEAPRAGVTMPLGILKAKAAAVLGPDRPVANIIIYAQPDRTWEFLAYKENDSALTYFGAVEYYQSVFLNPYTGVVTGARNYKTDLFNVVKYLHWSLLLSTRYGQPIVGWSTVIFVILLITGLVLWWPRRWTKALRERSFKIKWKSSFRRVNYDLHNVPGFYGLVPALLISSTGLVFAFRWAAGFIYFVAAGTVVPPRLAEARSDMAVTVADPLQRALQEARLRLPSAARYMVSPAAGRKGVVYLYAYRGMEIYYDYDVLQFDQYSGALLDHRRDEDKNAGEKLVGMNYDIHVGTIAGLTGKIIAFIASLVCASLPVTGFIIWWGKKYKRIDKFPNKEPGPMV
ncbi:MAG: PepSY domain-containing protein [Bacteroidetes bacterium]|nr:PepSY domain-containing protein [Bacteroidota bacterium]